MTDKELPQLTNKSSTVNNTCISPDKPKTKKKHKHRLPNIDFLNSNKETETADTNNTHPPRVFPISIYQPNSEGFGTFCGVINKQLITSKCPLPKGVCVWKHRSTGYCKYKKETLTIQSLAQLVGEHVPNEETVTVLKAKLLETLRVELL